MNTGMDQFLANYYGTTQPSPSAPTDEDQAKVAQAELFAKLATENGIDLNTLSSDQILDLYNTTFPSEQKMASATQAPAVDPDLSVKQAAWEAASKVMRQGYTEEDQVKIAQAVLDLNLLPQEPVQVKTAQQEALEKVAEYDYAGRVIAHSYVQELRKIAASTEEGKEDKGMSFPPAKKKDKEEKDDAKEAAARAHAEFVAIKQASDGAPPFPPKKDEEKKDDKKDKEEEKKAAARFLASLQSPRPTEKVASSNLDEFAFQLALQKAAAGGFDVEAVGDRMRAFYTLHGADLNTNTKVAKANDVETATEIRSLELLQGAGLQVTWEI